MKDYSTQNRPSSEEIAAAWEILRAAGEDLSRIYPDGFVPDAAYKTTMPDLQNGPASGIRGAHVVIEQVGIAGFRVPLKFARADGTQDLLETAVSGSVSLEAHKKGINMSRIMRSFYTHSDAPMSFAAMGDIMDAYLRDLESRDARLLLHISYPMLVTSLRSGLSGYQYYDFSLEICDEGGQRHKALHLDYVYASTCPCSLELSEHARAVRGQLATPHAQRSVARLSAALTGDEMPFEDMIALARRAVPTETQVMVKREDEQAFAELCAANPIFVEDAARLFAQELQNDPRIGDFRVAASHQESLHSHDAVAVLTQGPRFVGPVEPRLFASLVHASRA